MSLSRKEEERNEKIIRGLMKLPPNRRCINCNSLGPQYVCTNFWTFVCMTCSGIHREFTHRVKSVSMSKFTSQEVEALQEGGNQRARETFLKDWDPRGQRLPDNSNAEKIREFIKSVYVDKRFFAAKTSGKPPRDVMSTRNNEEDMRRASSYHSYSQSPPYDYQYEERRYGKQTPALTKKPGSDRGMFRFSSSSRLSDHVQEDRFANEVSNARVSDFSASSGGDPFRSVTQSPTYQRDLGFSSPSSETWRDILSEDVQQHPVNTLPNIKAKADLNQSGSSGSIELLHNDGMNVKSVGPTGKEYIAPTPEQSAVTHQNKDSSFPSFPHSSESGKFGGLDLFSVPQTFTSAPSAVDFFQLSDTSSASSVHSSQPPHNSAAPTFGPSSSDLFSCMPHQPFAETLKKKSPDMGIQKDEGWATFDMPWHVEPNKGIESLITVSETSTSNESLGKVDQSPSLDPGSHFSFHQDFSASGPSSMHNSWHEGLYNIGAPVNATDNQSWSSFEDPTTPFQGIYTQNTRQVPVQDPPVAGPYMAWGIAEDFKINKGDFSARLPIQSTTPLATGSLDASSELSVLDGPHTHGLDKKSHNPFDLPCDSDLESGNVPFLDMSSMQSSLPWFPENTAIPYNTPDALVFMAGQAPSRQIPNIATIGGSGNPFG